MIMIYPNIHDKFIININFDSFKDNFNEKNSHISLKTKYLQYLLQSFCYKNLYQSSNIIF